MPRRTLDSIQRRPQPRGPKRDQQQSHLVQQATVAHEYVARQTPPAIQRRVRRMWLAVGATMVVVVIGWAVLLRVAPPQVSGESGFFDTIAKKVGNLFNDEGAATPTTNEPAGDTEQLHDLRTRVFPNLEQ